LLLLPDGSEDDQKRISKRRSKNDFVQTYTQYRSQRCEGFPLRSQCHDGKDNGNIAINSNLLRLKGKSKKLLTSERVLYRRKNRPCDVEPVFGHWKYSKKFKRFFLRSKAKLNFESRLLAIAHNLKKRVGERVKFNCVLAIILS